ncbi:MAG: UbiA family prenyltransferase, partial [Planctomycetota bacterium]
AAGRLGVGRAWVFSILLAAAGLGVAAAVNRDTLVVLGGYLLLQALYTRFLKHKMLLDVIGIAMGFVLRAVAGAVAIGVEISPWLFVCTFTLCLFMGFCKRCNEIVTIGEPDQAAAHRPTLTGYTVNLLTHLITVSAGVAVVGFLLYATSPRTVGNFHTSMLVYTLPLVFYGVFRFAMLSMFGSYSDPTELILRDRPFQMTLVLWLGAAAAILKWADRLPSWLAGL